MAQMTNDKRKENSEETAKNAAAGYGAIVLSLVCFVLALSIITVAVRIVVGASTGAGA